MTPIHAAQLIFTNVEAEQSPRRRRGYQTLFYTRGDLPEAEVAEIEARLFYNPKGDPEPKHVFFQTRTGRAVIAHIVCLEQTDQFGRAGRYLAHALILSREEFARAGSDPFSILRSAPLFTTLGQALA